MPAVIASDQAEAACRGGSEAECELKDGAALLQTDVKKKQAVSKHHGAAKAEAAENSTASKGIFGCSKEGQHCTSSQASNGCTGTNQNKKWTLYKETFVVASGGKGSQGECEYYECWKGCCCNCKYGTCKHAKKCPEVADGDYYRNDYTLTKHCMDYHAWPRCRTKLEADNNVLLCNDQ